MADKVNELLALSRANKVVPPPVAIATAYVNPAGFALIADELESAPRVRLLLGAEPDAESVRSVSLGDSDAEDRRSAALDRHQAWLEAERDTMGFAYTPTQEARRMVEWLESVDPEGVAKVEVRRYTHGFLHGKTYLVQDAATPAAVAGSSNMTYAGLAYNAELNLGTMGGTHAAGKVSEWFEHYWDRSEPYDLAGLYGHMWDPHAPWTIYLRMLWELYGSAIAEEAPNSRTLLALTQFQADGVARMERLLDENGGVLVADEVGLGKTYLAGEVIARASANRQRVLIVAPAALVTSMWTPFLDDPRFSRWVDVYSYEKVRNQVDPAMSTYDAAFAAKMDDYSLIVVDEAHNLRNAGAQRSAAIDSVIAAGASPKKVVLLTATPVNNSLADLETLIKYFIRDDARFAGIGIPSIKKYIKTAQEVDPANLTPEHLFDLMDQVAVRRTRKFVKEHYPNETITGPNGKPTTLRFPQADPRRIDYPIDDAGVALIDDVVYALDDPNDPHRPNAWVERVTDPDRLMLARYLSSGYTLDHDLENYQITNAGLLRSGLLKRLESSPEALEASLERMIGSHEAFLTALAGGFVLTGEALADWTSSDSDDLVAFVEALDVDDRPAAASGYHLAELTADVTSDIELLRRLHALARSVVASSERKTTELTAAIAAGVDAVDPTDARLMSKVGALVVELARIAEDARRVDPRGVSGRDRRKVVIFSAFADTVIPIHDAVVAAVNAASSGSALSDYQGRVAEPIMGAYAKTLARGATGGVDQGGRATVIGSFAPETASERSTDGTPVHSDLYDILFTTDVLAEGVNLQQAGQMINYDLPWNPMRIVQRHGRVDRIGSKHDYVRLGLFFPAQRLDTMLRLEETIDRKLALADAAVGVGDLLPGRRPGKEINLTDDAAMDQFAQLLDNGGSSASLSGEEYRRRLYDAVQVDAATKSDVLALPYGSGAGFVSAGVRGNGFVFCVRIGAEEKPWFRYVAADERWNVRRSEDGVPVVSSDTLISLRVADPESPARERWLTEEVYAQAFPAWDAAREDVFATWTAMTDPNAFEPDVPAAFRDATDVVRSHGRYLEREAKTDLLRRLRSVPPVKVERAVRRALTEGRTAEEQITKVTEALNAAGIIAAPPREPLPPVEKHEVRLVAWMAIKGELGTA
ncbi:SNF2-related protein [Xylanimonas sp. McL0601]|uniref:SNF2-related protein n=1 Tax=Xylanimonas sp. McL0601 TaxID=3414739 RepID=UPI003CEEEA44